MVEPPLSLWQNPAPYRHPMALKFSGSLEVLLLCNQALKQAACTCLQSIYTGVMFKAEVAKLVYALDLGSSAARRESSSLSFRTIF